MKNLKNASKILKALADEGRLRILLLLHNRAGLCVCEIKDIIGLSQPTISSHLKQLEGAGLLKSEKEGLWVNYSLDEDMNDDVMKIVNSLYLWLEDDTRIREDMEKAKIADRHDICKR